MEYQSNLKIVREEKGWTQAELAEKSGVKLRSIQNYEQGFHDINGAKVVTVLCLAEALGCSVYDIIQPRVQAEPSVNCSNCEHAKNASDSEDDAFYICDLMTGDLFETAINFSRFRVKDRHPNCPLN